MEKVNLIDASIADKCNLMVSRALSSNSRFIIVDFVPMVVEGTCFRGISGSSFVISPIRPFGREDPLGVFCLSQGEHLGDYTNAIQAREH